MSNYFVISLSIYREDDEDAPDVTEFDERDIENVNFNNKSRSGSARKRRDSYDYINTVQMLGELLHTWIESRPWKQSGWSGPNF